MTLAQGIQEQCLSGARSISEIHCMIKAHQNEVLFILDGYEVSTNRQIKFYTFIWELKLFARFFYQDHSGI